MCQIEINGRKKQKRESRIDDPKKVNIERKKHKTNKEKKYTTEITKKDEQHGPHHKTGVISGAREW